MAAQNNEAKAGKSTRRVVLKRERVLVIPDNVAPDKLGEAIRALIGGRPGKAREEEAAEEAWVVVGEFEGASKVNAIEAHAGKPGTADAKPGTYRAPGLSAWQGGLVYQAPPQPLVERTTLDETV